ncbi:MAG: group 1 truncated hemoglobin [Burkholderiaceae bacterium]
MHADRPRRSLLQRVVAALLLFAVMGNAVQAQTGNTGDSLYRALGEKPGITALMNDFVDRVVKDPRVDHFFAKTKLPNLKEQFRDQICQLSGGPCQYAGDPMKPVHADLAISKADFNAVVKVLQLAMDARQIPFRDQNRLLALLAPMHRDIITR